MKEPPGAAAKIGFMKAAAPFLYLNIRNSCCKSRNFVIDFRIWFVILSS